MSDTTEPTFVPWGCLNLRWNDKGELTCIHTDAADCDLAPHWTVSTYVKADDLKPPAVPCTCPDDPTQGDDLACPHHGIGGTLGG